MNQEAKDSGLAEAADESVEQGFHTASRKRNKGRQQTGAAGPGSAAYTTLFNFDNCEKDIRQQIGVMGDRFSKAVEASLDIICASEDDVINDANTKMSNYVAEFEKAFKEVQNLAGVAKKQNPRKTAHYNTLQTIRALETKAEQDNRTFHNLVNNTKFFVDDGHMLLHLAKDVDNIEKSFHPMHNTLTQSFRVPTPANFVAIGDEIASVRKSISDGLQSVKTHGENYDDKREDVLKQILPDWDTHSRSKDFRTALDAKKKHFQDVVAQLNTLNERVDSVSEINLAYQQVRDSLSMMEALMTTAVTSVAAAITSPLHMSHASGGSYVTDLTQRKQEVTKKLDEANELFDEAVQLHEATVRFGGHSGYDMTEIENVMQAMLSAIQNISTQLSNLLPVVDRKLELAEYAEEIENLQKRLTVARTHAAQAKNDAERELSNLSSSSSTPTDALRNVSTALTNVTTIANDVRMNKTQFETVWVKYETVATNGDDLYNKLILSKSEIESAVSDIIDCYTIVVTIRDLVYCAEQITGIQTRIENAQKTAENAANDTQAELHSLISSPDMTNAQTTMTNVLSLYHTAYAAANDTESATNIFSSAWETYNRTKTALYNLDTILDASKNTIEKAARDVKDYFTNIQEVHDVLNTLKYAIQAEANAKNAEKDAQTQKAIVDRLAADIRNEKSADPEEDYVLAEAAADLVEQAAKTAEVYKDEVISLSLPLTVAFNTRYLLFDLAVNARVAAVSAREAADNVAAAIKSLIKNNIQPALNVFDRIVVDCNARMHNDTEYYTIRLWQHWVKYETTTHTYPGRETVSTTITTVLRVPQRFPALPEFGIPVGAVAFPTTNPSIVDSITAAVEAWPLKPVQYALVAWNAEVQKRGVEACLDSTLDNFLGLFTDTFTEATSAWDRETEKVVYTPSKRIPVDKETIDKYVSFDDQQSYEIVPKD